jgi:ribosomal protein S18 acetylase RimI-like enzyme
VTSGSISKVGQGDRASAIATLVSAFTEDPVERWLYPQDDRYAAHFPEFVAAFGGPAFAEQTAWDLDGFSAVALWFPPEVEADDDAVGAVLSETVAASKHKEMFSVLEQMGTAHPTYPHWYLPWLGVEAGRKNEGLGGRLLDHCLAIVDASHLPAFLENPNPRNISLYERHGFAVTATTQSDSCPPLTSMLRPATQD